MVASRHPFAAAGSSNQLSNVATQRPRTLLCALLHNPVAMAPFVHRSSTRRCASHQCCWPCERCSSSTLRSFRLLVYCMLLLGYLFPAMFVEPHPWTAQMHWFSCTPTYKPSCTPPSILHTNHPQTIYPQILADPVTAPFFQNTDMDKQKVSGLHTWVKENWAAAAQTCQQLMQQLTLLHSLCGRHVTEFLLDWACALCS